VRFKSRFYNSLAQGLSGKNEQPGLTAMARGPQRGGDQCICIRMHPLKVGPDFRKWKQFTWKRNGSNHKFHLVI